MTSMRVCPNNQHRATVEYDSGVISATLTPSPDLPRRLELRECANGHELLASIDYEPAVSGIRAGRAAQFEEQPRGDGTRRFRLTHLHDMPVDKRTLDITFQP